MDGYGGYDYGYDENVRPAENNAFVMRMAQDIAKRENEKRVNEMRKTVEGRRVLKQMGMMPAAKKTDKGMKVKPGKMIPEPQVLTASQILGSYAQEKAEVPKLVKYHPTKLHTKKEWKSEDWSQNTWIF